ncbi:MAG: chloride channel protein [Clostridia bacterium]|nr:chloride channel protein [Clostridia bacterium]
MSFKDDAKKEGKTLLTGFISLAKWLILASFTGVIVGLVGVLMVKGIDLATNLRNDYPFILYFMPVAGLICVFLYQIAGKDKDSGTNVVLEAIRSKEQIKFRTAPLIIISTILTHLVGGSSGREGAALQFGGSLGESISRVFRFKEKDRVTLIMCGMSAAFSAVFGVPLAAVLFPMEVASVGVMYYSALVPCVVSSLVAHEVALLCGVTAHQYVLPDIGSFTIKGVIVTVVLAVLSALLSIVFCQALHSTHHGLDKLIKNKYLRVLLGSAVLIGLTLIFGTDYNGVGGSVIVKAVESGEAVPYAFILKIIFTVITLSIGFKGGEIVPSFFVGATFGAAFGHLVGFSPEFCASLGLVGVFCGVTNCPLASLIIACEMFSFTKAPYYLIVVAITYLISGYKSIYTSQKIMYSKTEPTFLGKDK